VTVDEQGRVAFPRKNKTTPKKLSPVFKGCFKDTPDRVFPKKHDKKVGGFFTTGSVKKVVDQCAEMAAAANHNTFALQYDTECWSGSYTDYDKYGVETDPKKCGSDGGAYANMVYTIMEVADPPESKTAAPLKKPKPTGPKKKLSPVFRGCFKDKPQRVFPKKQSQAVGGFFRTGTAKKPSDQ